jgi:hypothetical protein
MLALAGRDLRAEKVGEEKKREGRRVKGKGGG